MSKAFDRMEWMFIDKILQKMGFHPKWIRNVMSCVRSVTYEVKYNDHLSEIIYPGRGLRQGDPLSPYLFIICSNWLSWKISQQQELRKYDGIKICRGAPPITHLFFADDSLLFFKTSQRSIDTVGRILSEYETISGPKINYDKSEICLSRNIELHESMAITNFLRVKRVDHHGNYLGLPFIFGSNKSEAIY